MSKNEFEMDFKKSFFFRGEIWKRVKNDSFRSDIGLGFGERGGTPPPRIPRSTFWGISALNFLFYESFVATHSF